MPGLSDPVLATLRVRYRIGQFSVKNNLVRSVGPGNIVVVIAALRSRIWTFVTHAAARLNATLRRLTRPLPLVTGLL